MTVGRGVSGAYSVDGAQAVGTAGNRRLGNCRNVRGVGCEFGYDGYVHHGFHRSGDCPYHVRVLPHGHAVTLGVRTGQVQLQAVRYRRENPGDLDKFFETAAEDRGQQKAILRHLQCLHQFQGFMCPRIGQAHRVDEAARRVLA